MPEDTSADILPSLQAWALVATVGLLPALACWWWSRPRWPLLPPRRRRAVPWGPLEVALFIVVYLVLQVAVAGLLGVSESPEGPQRVARLLRAQLVALPITALTCLLLPYATARARLYQFGLTCHRLGQNLVLGYLTWLLVSPCLYGIFWLVLQSVDRVPHPVERLLVSAPGLGSWLLVFGAVLLAAPLGEELSLRGFIQPSLVRNPLACDLIVVAVPLLALITNMSGIQEHGLSAYGFLLGVLLVLCLGYFAFDRWTRKWPEQNQAWRGIVATSTLFAALHPWPTPIPLFVLSLGLGWLRHRTQSLVGPIVMHFLFNVVGLLPFILKQMGVW